MINVLADRYLYNIKSYLPENINLTFYDPSGGLPELQSAQALLIRTVNPINKQTLPNIPRHLSFVGTGSAGTDHVDINYLKENDIVFSDAAGCNARSVAEYIGISLLLWSEKRDMDLSKVSIGIVGAGHVGKEVIELTNKLGIRTITYDPPRDERESDFISASPEELLNCDILSFHTPLTTGGDYPTFHWLDTGKLSSKNFELVLNTSRGGVIDERAILQAQKKGKVSDFIIDVWENEPEFNIKTAKKAFVKTPHIAGYSIQAKKNASKYVADALLEHFNIPKPKKKKEESHKIIRKKISTFDSLSSLLTALHPIKTYEDKLEKIIYRYPKERGVKFNRLRAEFPLRQEFQQIYLPRAYFERFPVLSSLGFSLLSTHSK